MDDHKVSYRENCRKNVMPDRPPDIRLGLPRISGSMQNRMGSIVYALHGLSVTMVR